MYDIIISITSKTNGTSIAKLNNSIFTVHAKLNFASENNTSNISSYIYGNGIEILENDVLQFFSSDFSSCSIEFCLCFHENKNKPPVLLNVNIVCIFILLQYDFVCLASCSIKSFILVNSFCLCPSIHIEGKLYF